MVAGDGPGKRATDYDEERELLGLWLSRVMFNGFVGFAPETRSFEEFLQAHGLRGETDR